MESNNYISTRMRQLAGHLQYIQELCLKIDYDIEFIHIKSNNKTKDLKIKDMLIFFLHKHTTMNATQLAYIFQMLESTVNSKILKIQRRIETQSLDKKRYQEYEKEWLK